MNRERLEHIKEQLEEERKLASQERDWFLVRQLGTLIRILETLFARGTNQNDDGSVPTSRE